MKKFISLLLVLSLLVSTCGASFADKLRLPSMLESIEDSAFYGNLALSTVELPYSAKIIESQAFAYSGVDLVILPETINYIAADAFEGTNAKVRAPQDSYAMNWALANGFSLDDGMNRDEAKEELDYLSQNGLNEEQFFSDLSDLIDTTGIENQDILADIAEINALIEESNNLANKSNTAAAILQQESLELANCSTAITQTDTASSVILTLGSTSLIMDRSIADQDNVSITHTETSDDGSIITMSASNGETWYMYESSGNYCISKKMPAQSRSVDLASRGVAGDFVNKANELWNRIMDAYGYVDSALAELTASTALEIQKLQEEISLCGVKANDYLERRYGLTQDGYNEFTKIAKSYQQRADISKQQLSKLTIRANILNGTANALKALNIFSLGTSVGKMIAYWKDLDEIEEHGHPTDYDATNGHTRIAYSMNYKIRSMRCYLVGNFLLTAAQLMTDLVVLASIVPSSGSSIIPGIVIHGIFSLLGNLLGNQMESAISVIYDYHAELHTYLYGWVKDYYTGEPIQDVQVTDGKTTIYTDANGYYELYVMDSVTLKFTKDEYEDDYTVVMPVRNEALQVPDRLLMKEPGIIYGYIYDETTRDRLSGVTVSCNGISVVTDANGYYEIKLPSRVEATITLDKSGYMQGFINVTPILNNPQQRDATITTEYGVIYGYIYNADGTKPLANVSVSRFGNIITHTNANGYYELTAPIYPSTYDYVLDGYGMIRLIVAAQKGKRIERSMKLQPSGIPLDAAHFPDEVFRTWLSTWDFNQNGSLEEILEIESITELDFTRQTELQQITTLKGIEYLWALRDLTISNADIHSLDLNDCYSLEKLIISNAQISSLDVSKYCALETLSVYDSPLTSLKVNGCISLQEVTCTYCKLTSMDVSGCPSLLKANFIKNPLQSVNASGNISIESLHVGRGNDWDSTTVATCKTLNVSGCTNLQYLWAYDCGITTVSTSGCSSLTYVNVNGEATLTGSLDLGTAKDLKTLVFVHSEYLTITVCEESPYYQKQLYNKWFNNWNIDTCLQPV